MDALVPYVPRLLVRWLADQPNVSIRDVPGTMVFCDVSGFTALSERLARRGRVGAEELTDALDSCFANVLSVAWDRGGGLIKFGGDALLVLFQGDGHERRACNAALGMRRALREFGSVHTSAGRVTVRMSAGVHSGVFRFVLAGTSHRELLTVGEPITQVVRAEAAARAGEVVVSRATARALPQSALGEARGSRRLLIRAVSDVPDVPEQIGAAPVAIESCIPVAVREHLGSGVDEAEHRNVSIGFINFSGTDALLRRDPGATTAALGQLVDAVQAAADPVGVTFLGSDIAADGGKLVLVSGAPTSYDDGEDRMLHAVTQLRGLDSPLDLRVGVSRGHVFAGHVGPRFRRTYTVMGDAVNVAARVMAHAEPGTVLATAEVIEAARRPPPARQVPPFAVKGKTGLLHAFEVEAGDQQIAATPRPAAVSTVFGRERELAILARALEAARGGSGRAVELVGEPGIGKSTLLEEFARRAQVAGLETTWISCDSLTVSNPYSSVRAAMRLLFPDDAARAGQLRDLARALGPEIEPLLPLLAGPLDLDIPDTPQSRAIDPEFRKQRYEQIAADLVLASRPTGSLLVIEDGHWMDEASRGLFAAIAERTASHPWIVCIARRDTGAGLVAARSVDPLDIHLEPLGAEAAGELARAEGADHLSPADLETLVQRSGGNPLFLRALLTAAAATGDIAHLPDSIGQLLGAQIDRLGSADRRLLRYCAVVGKTVEEPLLDAVLEGEIDVTAWDRLGEFLEPAGLGAWRFRHALIRDAAYEGLPYRSRRDAHGAVAEAVLARSEHVEEDAAVLAVHFSSAERHDAAWWFSRMAADAAREAYANVDAASLYERAVAAARHAEGVNDTELARVYEALGDVRRWAGKYPVADEAYARARSLRAGQPEAQAEILLKRVRVRYLLGRYSDALRLITRAEKLVASEHSDAATTVRVEVVTERAAMMQAMNRTGEAIRWSRVAIDAASAAGHRSELARAYTMLDWAYAELGRFGEADHHGRALAIYEDLGDLKGQALVHALVGSLAYWQGRWDDAVVSYSRGIEVRIQVGDPVFAALGQVNIAEVRADQARSEEAEQLLRSAIPVLRAAGDVVAEAFADMQLGRVLGWRGEHDEAVAVLGRARERMVEVGINSLVVDADAKLIEVLLCNGEADRALEQAELVLGGLDPTGSAFAYAASLHRLRGYALMQLGRLDEAGEQLARAAELAEERGSDYNSALAAQGQITLAGRLGERPDPALIQARDDVSAQLGLAAIVEPLPGAPANTCSIGDRLLA